MSTLLHDLRYALRQLRRTPGFTIVAVLVMALGIGANVALFTVVRGVLLKPLPFQDPDRLLMLYEHTLPGDQFAYNNVAGGMYAAWKAQNRSFSSMGLLQYNQDNLSGTGGQLPETLRSARVSWDMFPTLGVQPVIGRGFVQSDDSPAANGTVVLSWSLWKRRFGGDPSVLNSTVYLDAKPYTVIGIMPAWFEFPAPITQLWTPIYHDASQRAISMIDFHFYQAIGRLKPGVAREQATADLSATTLNLHNAHRDLPFVSFAANS